MQQSVHTFIEMLFESDIKYYFLSDDFDHRIIKNSPNTIGKFWNQLLNDYNKSREETTERLQKYNIVDRVDVDRSFDYLFKVNNRKRNTVKLLSTLRELSIELFSKFSSILLMEGIFSSIVNRPNIDELVKTWIELGVIEEDLFDVAEIYLNLSFFTIREEDKKSKNKQTNQDWNPNKLESDLKSFYKLLWSLKGCRQLVLDGKFQGLLTFLDDYKRSIATEDILNSINAIIIPDELRSKCSLSLMKGDIEGTYEQLNPFLGSSNNSSNKKEFMSEWCNFILIKRDFFMGVASQEFYSNARKRYIEYLMKFVS